MKGLLQCNAYYRDYYFAELMEAAKKRDIVLCDARDIVKEEAYDFTLNKEYNEKDISLQRGKQFNRLTDGYFWKSKERQFRHLNLGKACCRRRFLARIYPLIMSVSYWDALLLQKKAFLQGEKVHI